MRGPIHTTMISTALGISLLVVPSLYADHRDDLGKRPLTDAERAQLRTNDLNGGFYKDGSQADHWFYDFYDSSGDARMGDRVSSRNAESLSPAPHTAVADAANPQGSVRDANRTGEQETAFQQYYDEPWFYDQRDPAYMMSTTKSREDSVRTAGQSGEVLEGKIQGVKQVRHRTSGGQNTVVLLAMADGRRVISDLGPTQGTLDLALTQGDNLNIRGQREEIGPYSVLMANQIRSGVKRVVLNREDGSPEADNRQVTGSIEQFRNIPIRQTGQMHRTATVRTGDGRFALVDFGPSTAENVPANAVPGDRIMAAGPVVRVGNYPVLLANRFSINDSVPVRVARPDGEYVPPSTGRHVEAAQQESVNPSCVGGACEGNTIIPSLARDRHSNATSGTARSERR